MKDIEKNDDEMIVIIVGDDDNAKTDDTSEDSEPGRPVHSSVKVEPIEHFRNLYCAENVNEIEEHEEFMEIEPDIEVLDEEYLSQEFHEVEKLIQSDDDIKNLETNVSRSNRTPRKTNHIYKIDEQDFSKNNKKKSNNVKSRKTKKSKAPAKLKPKLKQAQKEQNVKKEKEPDSVAGEGEFLEIEFLEDDVVVSSKTAIKEEFSQIEFLDDPPKKTETKTELEQNIKIEDDDEYIPEDEYEEIDDISEEEFVPTKVKRKPKTSRKTTKKASKQTKAVDRPIKSFIAELKKKQPIFKVDEEKLVDYLVDYMRKRTPPPPPPHFYYLNVDNRYSCSYCDIVKPTEAAASRHYQAAHGPRYLVCLACGSGFRSTVILYKHEKRCYAPDATIQLRARGVFLGRKGRGRPFLTANKFVPKEPPPDRPPKRVHIPHALKTKYYCSQCPAYFTREYLLDEHMHKHTGYRAFQCPDCPAAYVSRYQLNKHSKKHSDMQYICDHCGRVFKLKTTLTSHMDTHLPRPRFGCGRCGRRYAKRAAVRVHIMRDHMHMPPPAACPVCPKRYNRMSHVKLHMKRDHGLIMLTQRSIERDLPYMKVEDLDGAKVVFDKNDGIENMDLNPTLNKQILP